jgi:uncharacterized protein
MADTPAQPPSPRSEPFGYRCGRCRNCCRHYLVPVNAYEATRLAGRLGVTDTEFRKRYTRRGQGRELAHDRKGACVFLGDEGCTVYADRPLTCRLYPLRRFVDAEGNETWGRASPHPRTRGDYAVTGTIADFLDRQDAHEHIRAFDAAEPAARNLAPD